MPTADSFAALGKGNGFPSCLDKLDVSPYDYWITLGGFKESDGGSPTTTQINNSLINAMKLVWNCYSFSWTATSDAGEIASFDNDANNEFREPFENVCHGNFIGIGLYQEAKNSDDQIVARVQFSSIAKIHRFYNGDETNENNFIGYGIKAGGSPTFKGFAAKVNANGIATGNIQAQYFGFVDEGQAGLYNFSYVEISDIPFVLRERTAGDAGSSAIGNPSINYYTY
jgi:hypothetical protein